jgi:hypothetical protein
VTTLRNGEARGGELFIVDNSVSYEPDDSKQTRVHVIGVRQVEPRSVPIKDGSYEG